MKKTPKGNATAERKPPMPLKGTGANKPVAKTVPVAKRAVASFAEMKPKQKS